MSWGWNRGLTAAGRRGSEEVRTAQGSGLVIGWMVALSEDLGRGEGLRETLSLSGSC